MSFLPSRPSAARWGACALLALSVSGLMSTPAQAQWKWRDKNDRVQYSDLPPPSSVPESAILQRPQGASRRGGAPQFMAPAASAASSPALPASGPVRTADPELEAKRKKAEQDEAAKRKVEESKLAAAQAENCSRARAQLRMMESGMRVAQVNAKGEREIMDDKARADETKRARDMIASDCK
jgi:hypothetical protein